MGTSRDRSFSGADRRAALPPYETARPPRAAVWLLAAALVVLAGAPAGIAVSHQNAIGDGWPVSDFSGVLGLVTIAAWFAVWNTSGRGSPARVALALVPCWAVLEFSGTPARIISDRSPWSVVTALTSLAAVFLLQHARRSPEIDVKLRPFRSLVLIAAAIALIIAAVLLVVRSIGDVPSFVTVSAGAIGAGAWCLAAQMCRSSRRLDSRQRYYLMLAFLAFAIGSCDLTFARLDPTSGLGLWSFTCGRVIQLFGWGLLFAVAVHSLVVAKRVAARRDYCLRFARDDVLDRFTARQREIDERRHDLKSLIAGIQDATSTLLRYRESLDPSEQRELETALLAEVSRLRRSIELTDPPNTFNLRQAIGPVITAERLSGAVISVDLVDVEVAGIGDEIAALVQNLVINSRRHAVGANIVIAAEVVEDAVYLTIGDDGPGLPVSARARVEALLGGSIAIEPVNVAQALPVPRGSGLGLGICARIAREQGIDLQLLERPRGCHFQLRLRLAVAVEPACVDSLI